MREPVMPFMRSCLLCALGSIAPLSFTVGSAHAADAAAGRTVFSSQCAGCHAVKPGQPTMGPFLGGVVGRKAAAVPGFNYSAAMKSSGLTWDEATLDSFLAAPMKKLPGTSMPVGVAAPEDRADVIAYLATLVSEKGASASPAPAGLPPTATDFVVAGGPSQGAIASRP
jgi:cytochrome c2